MKAALTGGPSRDLSTGSAWTCPGVLGAHRRPTETPLRAGSWRFPLAAFTGRRPRFPRGFLHPHPGVPGSEAERKAKAAARGPSGRPDTPRGCCSRIRSGREGCYHTVSTQSSTLSATRVPRRCRSPDARAPACPDPNPRPGTVTQWRPPAAGPGPPHLPRSAPPAGPRGPSSRASEQDAPTGVGQLGGPNFGFPSDTTPSLERAPASASLHQPPPEVLTAQPRENEMPCEGRSPGFWETASFAWGAPRSSTRNLWPDDFHPGTRPDGVGGEGVGSWSGRRGGSSAELLGCSYAPLAARGRRALRLRSSEQGERAPVPHPGVCV